MPDPETRPSLLLRVRDACDQDAWAEFAAIYQPVIRAMAIGRGMQAADVDDLVQQVMMAIAGAIDRFEPDGERARFRTWLRTIAHRAIVNALTRRPRDQAAGGADRDAMLQQLAQDDVTVSLTLDYRREIFRVAADQISHEFHSETWSAFWETAVMGRSVDEVAAEMGKSRGNIYTARSRVMMRLKAAVENLDVELT
jgi:RNA polymerase sigma-70 factor (ECF subfamily)